MRLNFPTINIYAIWSDKPKLLGRSRAHGGNNMAWNIHTDRWKYERFLQFELPTIQKLKWKIQMWEYKNLMKSKRNEETSTYIRPRTSKNYYLFLTLLSVFEILRT